jgi:ferredoxin-NADP reductase
MLRHRAAAGSGVPARLVYSARALVDLIYRDELETLGADVRYTLTREAPDGWTGRRGRLDAAFLAEVAWPASERPLAYVCGPTGFVEAAASGLVALGHEAARIRTERFGPSGGPS